MKGLAISAIILSILALLIAAALFVLFFFGFFTRIPDNGPVIVKEKTTDSVITEPAPANDDKKPETVATKRFCDENLSLGFAFPENWVFAETTEGLPSVPEFDPLKITLIEKPNQELTATLYVNVFGGFAEGSNSMLIDTRKIMIGDEEATWDILAEENGNRTDVIKLDRQALDEKVQFVTFVFNFARDAQVADDELVKEIVTSLDFSCAL
jgi:hypothetical protein